MQLIARKMLALAPLLACSPSGGARFDYPLSGGDTSSSDTAATFGSEGDEDGSAGPSGPPGLPPPGDPTATGTSGSDPGGAGGGQPNLGGLIPANATWRYLPLQTVVAGDWKAVEFDDSTWPEGQAPFGDAAGDLTVIDAAAAPLGLRLRKHIDVPAGAAGLTLRGFVRRGDGVAVYLNGAAIMRTNLPPEPLAADSRAEVDLTGDEALRYIRIAATDVALLAGDNVVAVDVRRRTSGQAGLGFDLQLDVWNLSAEPADSLSAQVRTRSYGGEYADEHVAAAWIEGAGKLVRTLMVYAEAREQHLIRWRALSDGDAGDAVTGATRSSHRTRDLTWDLRDSLGQPAPPGDYTLVVEFTEDNSNEGAPPGPVLEIPFTLGGGPHLAEAVGPAFRDVLVVSP